MNKREKSQGQVCRYVYNHPRKPATRNRNTYITLNTLRKPRQKLRQPKSPRIRNLPNPLLLPTNINTPPKTRLHSLRRLSPLLRRRSSNPNIPRLKQSIHKRRKRINKRAVTRFSRRVFPQCRERRLQRLRPRLCRDCRRRRCVLR